MTLKQYMARLGLRFTGVRLVAKEPAQRIFDIIKSFPLSIDHAGGVNIEITATGADREMFDRAFAWIEVELLNYEEHCENHAAHATITGPPYQYMILNELMFWTMFVLDISPVNALWGPRMRENLFGPPLNEVCIVCGPLPTRPYGQNQPLLPWRPQE